MYINFAFISLILVALGEVALTEKLLILLLLGFIVTAVSFMDDLDTIFKFDRKQKTLPLRTAEDLAKVRKTPFAISPKARLVFQICVGAIVGLTTIKISYVSGIFGGIVQLDTFAIMLLGYEVFLVPLIFTIIWYVLVFNSVNWSDGIPGLTAGLTTIALIVIAILTVRFYLVDETPALRENSVFVFGIISILLPTMLVAWYYNINVRMLL